MKPTQTLYLLAADRDFRLLRGARSELAEITHRKADDYPDVHGRDAPPPSRGQSGGISFNTTEPGAHEAEERRRFACYALEALEKEWAKGKADRIVIAAGPRMLGELRDQIPKALAAHVAAEMPKDLIRIAVHDLPAHFEDLPGA